MATKSGRNSQRKTGPTYGPSARRARERFLDEQASGSRTAKYGAAETTAPIPAPVLPPSKADLLFRLAKDLRRAGAPARALAKAQAKAAQAKAQAAQDTAAAEEAVRVQAEDDARRLAAQRAADAASLEAARQDIVREAARAAAAEMAAQAEERRREIAARQRAQAERAQAAAAARAAAEASARDHARALARLERVRAARAASDAAASTPRPTAAIYRGRVDPQGLYGAILVMAPAPGGRAARCYAELLRRQVDPKFAGHRLLGAGALDTADPDDGPEPTRLAREDLLALADLYREADGFYRTLDVPPGEGLPVNGNTLRATAPTIGGSISSQLVEG